MIKAYNYKGQLLLTEKTKCNCPLHEAQFSNSLFSQSSHKNFKLNCIKINVKKREDDRLSYGVS